MLQKRPLYVCYNDQSDTGKLCTHGNWHRNIKRFTRTERPVVALPGVWLWRLCLSFTENRYKSVVLDAISRLRHKKQNIFLTWYYVTLWKKSNSQWRDITSMPVKGLRTGVFLSCKFWRYYSHLCSKGLECLTSIVCSCWFQG